MIKRKPKPCTCKAYPFPHRLDGGKCKDLYNSEPLEKDSLDSLGLISLFAPDNRQPLRF